MEGLKRKRDDEGTVVTFYAPDRTFQRVFKGQSLAETKDVVRKKLGLSDDASIRFSRLHEGRHIDLEDEDDFEAFRHLARYVHSLDVSVFVGAPGTTPIFTQRAVEASATEKHATTQSSQPLPISTSSGRPAAQNTLRVDPASSSQPSTSTLDAQGVPKKKRKRKEVAPPPPPPPPPHPGHLLTRADRKSMSPEPSRPAKSSRKSKKSSKPSTKSGKEPKAAQEIPQEASAPAPSSSSPAVPKETPAIAAGSKRKRHESPEAPNASSGPSGAPLPNSAPASRPPSPSSPARKKRKKDKKSRAPGESPSTSEASAAQETPDKKGKRKADAAAAPDARTLPDGATADIEDSVVVDAAAKRSKKKEKKKAGSGENLGDASEAPRASEKPSKKKRKHKEAEGTEGVGATVEVASSLAGAASTAPEQSKGKSKEQDVLSAEPVEHSLTDDAPSATKPPKRKEGKRSKDILAHASSSAAESGSSAIEATTSTGAPVTAEGVAEAAQTVEKKRKRRKTLAADTSVDPDASTASTSALADATESPENPSVSTTSKKRDNKKGTPTSPSQVEPSEETSAILRAAFDRVIAKLPAGAGPSTSPALPSRASPVSIATSASASPSASVPTPTSDPTSEPVLPSRKRKAGKSKLRQAWGPEDITGDESEPVPVAASRQQSSDVAPGPADSVSATRTAHDEPANTPKAAKRKKGRPSSAPSCPICDKVSVHSRSECPIVQGGPESIRERIAQLKQGEHDEELVDELEVLLKEAQRRRKSASSALIQVGTASAESTPSPVFPLSAAKFTPPNPARPAPLPHVPAGSEISEVAIESKDEGSSNEGSSDEEDEEDDAEVKKAVSTSFGQGSTSGSNLASVDLEALLRGPVQPRKSILDQIPSESTTEDEESSDEEARPDEEVDLSEEEKHDRAYRRMSRKLERDAPSSDEEHEPDLGMGREGMDVDEQPVAMDEPPNSRAPEMPDVESDAREPADEGGFEERVDGGGVVAEDNKGASDQGYESDAEEAAQPQTSPHKGKHDSADEKQEPGPDASPDDQDADGGAEPTVEVEANGAASQGSPDQMDENPKVDEPAPGGDESGSDEDDAEAAVDKTAEAAVEQRDEDSTASGKSERETARDAASATSADRNISPELGEPESAHQDEQDPSPSSASRLQTAAADVDMSSATDPQAESIDLRPDDPSDPIESLGSFADVAERRPVLEDDPIEDVDSEAAHSHSRTQEDQGASVSARSAVVMPGMRDDTPPPAAHRTPGTVSRMKDRYGRLSHASSANGREKLPSLSQQILASLEPSLSPSPQNADVEMPVEDGEQNADQDQDQDQEQVSQDGPEEASVAASEKADRTEASDQRYQPEREEQEETRPRRTTRGVARRTSAMPSSSNPEPPASTPTPAPAPPPPAAPAAAAPKRRGGRLTAEEKAAREAEKKAERERKAAEKLAEKEAKAAQKKAEKEAKEAAKRAEKEAKEAAKRAAKEEKEKEKVDSEAPKRGKARATRGRGASTSAKPVSTRSRAAVSADVDVPQAVEEEPEEGQDAGAASTPKVSWTTLPDTQPRTQSEVAEAESSMIDELQPSSPGRTASHASRTPEPISRSTNTTEKDEADVSREVTVTQERPDGVDEEREDDDEGQEEDDRAEELPTTTPRPTRRNKEPLFIPSSSQFPTTPFSFPTGGLVESTPFANGSALDDDSGSDGGDDTANKAGTLARTRSRPSAWMDQAPYRRLSDLASQQLFPASQIPSPALYPASQPHPRKPSSAYGHHADEDDDDDDDESDDDGGSSSDSDSEAGAKVKKSHIPQERRAGAGVQKRKKRAGLLAFA